MVVLHHAGFAIFVSEPASGALEQGVRQAIVAVLHRMNLGVPLFFVISGYCILASADAHRRQRRSPLRFLARRFWRIYPPYWVACLGFLAITWTLPRLGLEHWLLPPHALEVFTPDQLNLPQWIGNITLTETWRPLLGGGPSFVWTRIAWSLCYEEQFYLVAFMAILFAPKRLYIALIGLTILAGLIRIALTDVGMSDRIQGTFPLLWHEFAMGLAVYGRLNVALSNASKRWLELSIVLLILPGLVSRGDDLPVHYSHWMASAFALLIILLRSFDSRLMACSCLNGLRACGRRCYSIYLMHLPICTVGINVLWDLGIRSFWGRCLVTIPLVSITSVAFCFAFFWLVERHFLNPPVFRVTLSEGIQEFPLTAESAEPEAVSASSASRGSGEDVVSTKPD